MTLAHVEILFELLLVLKLLMSWMGERLENSAHPPPTNGPNRLHRHFDKKDTSPKATYDAIAIERLCRKLKRNGKAA